MLRVQRKRAGSTTRRPGVNPSGNVLAKDTDVDSGDTKAVTTTGTFSGAHGTISLAADGRCTYTVNNSNAAVDALRPSTDTLTDSFSYTMKDTAGATSTATLTITIQGAQRRTARKNCTTGTFTGAHGTLSLAADGSYTYTVNNSDAAVDALWLSTDTLTDSHSYTMKDTAGQPRRQV
jgi:trimeric autotransporter adhesin